MVFEGKTAKKSIPSTDTIIKIATIDADGNKVVVEKQMSKADFMKKFVKPKIDMSNLQNQKDSVQKAKEKAAALEKELEVKKAKEIAAAKQAALLKAEEEKREKMEQKLLKEKEDAELLRKKKEEAEELKIKNEKEKAEKLKAEKEEKVKRDQAKKEDARLAEKEKDEKLKAVRARAKERLAQEKKDKRKKSPKMEKETKTKKEVTSKKEAEIDAFKIDEPNEKPAIPASNTTTRTQENDKKDNVYGKVRLFYDSLASSHLLSIPTETKMHYHAEHSEHLLLVSGQGMVLIKYKTHNLQANDLLFVPKGVPHKIINTGKGPLKILSIQAPFYDGTDKIILE